MKIFLLKYSFIFIFALSVFAMSATHYAQPPEAEITNGLIHARIYLPDPDIGYYRGSRFDWSGVIFDLTYKEHSFYGQWFPKYDPRLHDAIMGPVEDFSPLGYEVAKPGESFIKIGIGVLIKPDASQYFIATPYEIVNPGTWETKKRNNQIEFIHRLKDSACSYEYKKTIILLKGKPEMVLSHVLKNTGKQVIETSVYDHNFFMLDQQPTGQGFTIRFPFKITGEGGNPEFANLQGDEIVFFKDLAKKDHVYFTALHGYGDSAKDYDIKIENKNTGAGVRITSDQPISRLVFWSASTTVCPEPYIRIKINPGESFSWKILYHYYSLKDKQIK
jgi:hypothetical protein